MKDLAPDITRQRLIVEGFFEGLVDEEKIREFFKKITGDLGLRVYGDPVIFCPESLGKEENAGYDAFIPLIDSGISLYVWSKPQFFSVIIFTCKHFDTKKACQCVQDFFGSREIEFKDF